MSRSIMTLEVLNPRGVRSSIPYTGLSNPRVENLSDQRIALISEKPDSVLFFNALEKLIKKNYPSARVFHFASAANPAIQDNSLEIADSCDIWMEGIKTSGSSNVDCGINMEKRGKPGVAFCVDTLLKQRRRLAEVNGMPALRIMPIRSVSFYSAKGDQEKMNSVAKSVFGDTLRALTDPLTKAEKNPDPLIFDYGPLRFSGNTYFQIVEQFQQFCADNFMNDGLPVVPPTREAVDWMLAGTSRSSQEEIGLLAPRYGMATVEKIAINAVMAGAKPEYLPVIIAAIECLTDKHFNSYHLSMGPVPLIWINGPIAEEIGMNSGIGYLSPGFRANSTIGRAIGLCLINLGWRLMDTDAVPGGPGNPAAYCNYVVSENEKDSPWGSFAVENGYSSEQSTITINETIQFLHGPGEGRSSQSLQQSLDMIIELLIPKTDLGFPSENRRYELLLHPTLARQLADIGFTRQSLAQWLYEKTCFKWEDLKQSDQEAIKKSLARGMRSLLKLEDCKPGLVIRSFSDPRQLAILVVGDAGGTTLVLGTPSGSTSKLGNNDPGFQGLPFMTKIIRGATLTKSGR